MKPIHINDTCQTPHLGNEYDGYDSKNHPLNVDNRISVQPNTDYTSSSLDTFSRIKLRQELLRGLGDPFDGQIELFWSWRESITSRAIEIGASPSDELQILKANTRGRPHDIIQDFAIAGIISPSSTVSEV